VLLVQEGNDWHVFAVGSNNVFHHFEAGSSLDNPLTLNYAGSLGNTLADPKNIQLVKSGSIWSGIIVNNAGQNLSILSFPQGCSTGIQSSTFASPTTITYPPGTNGYQTYELREIVNDTVFIYTDSVMVDILPPKAYFGFNNTCSGTPVEFFDSSEVCFGAISSWSWDFGDGNTSSEVNPTHTFADNMNGHTVTLTVTSALGCTDVYSVFIPYKEDGVVLYVPNTFTPDGDENNQLFAPVFTSGFDPYSFEITVYNRWGETVWVSNDATVGWDGTYGLGGRDAQQGVYTWKITYKEIETDRRATVTGHVLLIR
jgi:gliding motility-associated-like protein